MKSMKKNIFKTILCLKIVINLLSEIILKLKKTIISYH